MEKSTAWSVASNASWDAFFARLIAPRIVSSSDIGCAETNDGASYPETFKVTNDDGSVVLRISRKALETAAILHRFVEPTDTFSVVLVEGLKRGWLKKDMERNFLVATRNNTKHLSTHTTTKILKVSTDGCWQRRDDVRTPLVTGYWLLVWYRAQSLSEFHGV